MRQLPPAPRPAQRPLSDTRHGITRTDEYAWLRDANWQAVFKDPSVLDADIKAHLDAENAHAQAWLAPLADLRAELVREMRGRIKEDDESIPVPEGPFAYGSSYVEGGQQPRFYRVPREDLGAARDILLDGDKEAEGKAFFSNGTADASHDHSKLLWSHDDNGSEYYTLVIRDLATRADLADRVKDTSGGGVWTADDRAIAYVHVDDNHRPSKVLLHTLGTDQSEDRLIYEEADPAFFVEISGSRLNDVMFVSVGDHESSEVLLLDATDPAKPAIRVAPRQAEVEYSLEEGGDVFFILTNIDGAKDFRIMVAPAATPQREHWQDVVPHEAGRLILSLHAYSRHIVWLERRDGLPRIMVKDRATGAEHAIAFAEEAYSLGLQGAAEYDTNVIRFSYSSMTTPNQLFDYDMATRERRLLKTQTIPSGHEPADYVTRRVFAPAADGETVPVSLLYRRDTVLDGSAPCLLYGYGAYGITVPASFSTNVLSLVDRGFVYAIAHIRGGKDKGWRWYETGKKRHKINSFTDFIAAGEHLVREGFTARGRIIAEGRSAGGLLMGGITNMAPTLFGGIIAGVPFVDALNTMLDASLPLTPPEWTEWGNPIESAEEYQWIAAYSPYDNVAALPYPPVLALAGLTDPRVTYWEPAKWVARLRDHSTSGADIIFDINMDAGHGGASGRFARLEEIAKSHAFAIDVASRFGA
jgi:oligopeptidase B